MVSFGKAASEENFGSKKVAAILKIFFFSTLEMENSFITKTFGERRIFWRLFFLLCFFFCQMLQVEITVHI